ncbi:MAG: hypothetical protein ACI9G1_003567 [Pirellulaceae bacterium]|jgi:hypothetical protein
MDLIISYWPAIVLVAVLVLALVAGRLLVGGVQPPYEKRPSLLTNAELKFYHVLKEVVGDLHIVAMVRMADLIRVKSDTQQRQAWQNKIQAKHIDFVLCDKNSMEPVVAIELDDSSHQRPDRVQRDQFVNGAFQAAGLNLLRIPVRQEYNKDELKKVIQDAANGGKKRRRAKVDAK